MLEIRKLKQQDFEQIVQLLHELWPEKALYRERLREVFERGLASSVQYYLCAVEDSLILGFCSMVLKNNLWVEGYLAHIDELVVHRAARGRGIGTRLLKAMIKVAGERGCPRVDLDSAFHRVHAHAFYEHQGFENRAYLFSKPLV